MYIEEYEFLEIILKRRKGWKKKLGYYPENIANPVKIHWTLLKSTSYRTLFIKVKCDDCGEIFERRIRDLDENKNFHLCGRCQNKGERNGQFDKPKTEKQLESIKKWMSENGNPFSWESVKFKLKEKQLETTYKVVQKNTGKVRTEQTKRKMSEAIKECYKNGKIIPGTGYKNIPIKLYKNLMYQGSYELKFLQFVENLGYLNLLERGPQIEYMADDTIHQYFIDYKIKDTDIVFEIKSSYYWKKAEKINILKKESAEQKYNYHLIIDNNFKNINKIFENLG